MLDSQSVGDKKVASVHPDFINVDNISILCDPSAEMLGNLNDDNSCGSPKVLSAFFVTLLSPKCFVCCHACLCSDSL